MLAVIDPTSAGARLRKQGWLALLAMLALVLMPALARPVASGADVSTLPRIICGAMSARLGAEAPVGINPPSSRGDPRATVCPDCVAAGQDHLMSAAPAAGALLDAGSVAPEAAPTTARGAMRAPAARARAPPCAAGPVAA